MLEIQGVNVEFPFDEPYPIQSDIMKHVQFESFFLQ